MAVIRLREARPDDHEDVVAMTRNTWTDRGDGDYLADAYPRWIDGEDRHTLVAEVDDPDPTVVGIGQSVLLSEHEAWGQGLRVDPDWRGEGISRELTEALFDWAAGKGATTMRVMVFSWNVAGLGQARGTGYDPVTEFRWAEPTPDLDASTETDSDLSVVSDPDVAWRVWSGSEACRHLRGLTLDFDESWAVSELTREDLHRAAEETAVLAVVGERARAMSYRVRTYEYDGAGGPERRAEYGIGAWDDLGLGAARALIAAIARDAAEIGADTTRVLVPETVEYVSDVAATRTPVSDDPDFVLAKDLTSR